MKVEVMNERMSPPLVVVLDALQNLGYCIQCLEPGVNEIIGAF